MRRNCSIKYASAAVGKEYFITKFRGASATSYGGNDWLLRYAVARVTPA